MEHIDLNSLNIFIRLAESQSFSETARSLGIQKSKVSRSISSLEESLGNQLFFRTTREVKLTPFGKDLYANCYGGFESIKTGLQKTLDHRETMTGTVRITAVEDIGVYFLTPIIARFGGIYPNVHVDMIYTSEVLDLVKNSIDIGFRVGKVSQRSYRIRKVGTVKFILVAAPNFLSRFNHHISIKNLNEFPLLSFKGYQLDKKKLVLFKNQQKVELSVLPHFQSTSTTALLEIAKSGLGVALLPDFLCRDSIKKDQLISVCNGWHTDEKAFSIVRPSLGKKSPIVDLFANFVVQEVEASPLN